MGYQSCQSGELNTVRQDIGNREEDLAIVSICVTVEEKIRSEDPAYIVDVAAIIENR